MDQLQDYIDRYFEARLSQAEERDLLRHLLKMEGHDPVADEVLAVMLASRMMPKGARSRNRPRITRIAGIAASIALIFGTGVFLIHQPKDTQSFAYVSGKKIHDPNEIKNIVATQLQDIGESTALLTRTLSTDLEDIREALTDDEI